MLDKLAKSVPAIMALAIGAAIIVGLAISLFSFAQYVIGF